jgi:DNA-binding CsgD family transcriptional regulator
MVKTEEKLSPSLTVAEEKVLALVRESQTNKEIALSLGVSPATIKRHVENIFRKLRLKNRVEAALYAMMREGCPLSGAESIQCPLEVRFNGKGTDGSYGPSGQWK